MKPKTKTILFILLSFILGALCGWFVQDRVFIKTGHTPPDFQKMLTERLHLDGGQIAQVDSILDARRQQMDVHRKRMLAMRDTIQMEIRRVLSPEQVKLFDAIIQEINEREAKRHEPTKK
ncbi:MAG: hypothetical protein ABR936_03360 [Bacteroidota bacterium]|jgi:uncharacterized protein YneF (UPF0154 family)